MGRDWPRSADCSRPRGLPSVDAQAGGGAGAGRATAHCQPTRRPCEGGDHLPRWQAYGLCRRDGALRALDRFRRNSSRFLAFRTTQPDSGLALVSGGWEVARRSGLFGRYSPVGHYYARRGATTHALSLRVFASALTGWTAHSFYEWRDCEDRAGSGG